jgi:hypothetical protein
MVVTDDPNDDGEPSEDVDRADDGEPNDGADSPDDEPSVECRLTEPEARERLDWVEAELVDDLSSVAELEDGFRFEFAGTDDTLRTVGTFVALESTCCSFARFEIEVPPESKSTFLTVTGPEGTKELGLEGGLFDLAAVPDPD